MRRVTELRMAAEDLLKGTSPKSREERIFVSIRVRPLNAGEASRNDMSDWECTKENTIFLKNASPDRVSSPASYKFDRVFGCESSTKQVYEEGAKEVALSVLSGINSTIFAYGQTSSGKTYTMSGITEYSVTDIYHYIEMQKEREFVIKFSAIEIYNEAVRDLLGSEHAPLRLLDDPEKGVKIDKLTAETVKDLSHLQALLYFCESQRKIAETSLNETSSRSHQILRMTVESSPRKYPGSKSSGMLAATLNFVDLAGSERSSHTMSVGLRLKEGSHINRSLLTLGTVIRKLSKGRNGHIPYRDSKLTRILQNSLGGNARTAVICTISPASSHVEQSKNTLFFATCAKEVTTNSMVNVVMSDKQLVKQLQKELAKLAGELKSLGSSINTSDSAALLREKELLIEKMDKEMKELAWQRDLAQSRVEHLLQTVGEDRFSKLDEDSVSAFSDVESVHLDSVGLNTFKNFYMRDREVNHPKMDSPVSVEQEAHFLLEEISLRYSGVDLSEAIAHTDEVYSEEIVKEVQCIETEDPESKQRAEDGFDLLPPDPEENEETTTRISTQEEENMEQQLIDIPTDQTYGSLDLQVDEMQKTISSLETDYPSEPVVSSSRGRGLTRVGSSRSVFMTIQASPWSENADHDENRPTGLSDRDSSRKKLDVVLQGKPFRSKYEVNSRKLGRRDNSDYARSVCTDVRVAREWEEDDNASVLNFETGNKRRAKKQSNRYLLREGTELDGSRQRGGEDGYSNRLQRSELQFSWLWEFERQRKEIIELWDSCNVPLVDRTYFFIIFKGGPSDSVYMEVELRRLSFIRDTFSGKAQVAKDKNSSSSVTRGSSMKALNKEREMLSKRVKKKMSTREREALYQKWGIMLKSKERSLQVARRVWTSTQDLEHIKESAALVAKLIGFSESNEAPRGLFGISFLPKPSKKPFSWRYH